MRPAIAWCRRDSPTNWPPASPTVLASARTATSAGPRVVGEAEFQARLDDVLARCMAAPLRRAPRRPACARPRSSRPATVASGGADGPGQRRRRDAGWWRLAAPTRARCASPSTTAPHDGVTRSAARRAEAPRGARDVLRARRSGQRAARTILRRIVDEGHLLGHHSWSHSAPHETSARRLLAEVRRTRDWLRAQFGTDFTWFRPPHGKVSTGQGLRAVGRGA